jgi:hypothetical protein
MNGMTFSPATRVERAPRVNILNRRSRSLSTMRTVWRKGQGGRSEIGIDGRTVPAEQEMALCKRTVVAHPVQEAHKGSYGDGESSHDPDCREDSDGM